MARTDDAPGLHDGFEGELSGLGLADLVQLNARNRFSGCFRIRNGEALGLIYFRDGEIVHSELGEKVGEAALLDILEWPAGRFGIDQNVVTARRTIHKSVEHLLLDAHRAMDERRASGAARTGKATATPIPAPAPVQPAAGASVGATAAVQSVQGLPGVAGAVVITRDGRLVGSDGHGAEVLAGQAAYLAMVAAELGKAFQAGDARYVSVQGSRNHLLLFAARNHYLCVLAHPDSEIGVVEAAVRRALGGR